MVGSRVYVGGLPYGTRERDLEKFFKGYGRTRDILIKNGYGFVEFEDYRDADDAVYELNGKELLGERSVGLCHKLQSSYQSTPRTFILNYSALAFCIPKQGCGRTGSRHGERFRRSSRPIQ